MKPLTVPTMRELKKAAVCAGADTWHIAPSEPHPAIFVFEVIPGRGRGAMTGAFPHTAATDSFDRARYLAGEHIAALKRMQEAGL